MTNITYSVSNIPIRLTDERWTHIVESHDDMAGYYFDVLETIANPTWIFKGDQNDELWAVKRISEKKAMLVVYRELKEKNDGFVITALFTTKIRKLLRRKIIWQQQEQ